MSGSLHESLVILAAPLICGLHPEQVDSLADHQLFGIVDGVWRQEARPAQDPGIINMEQAKDVSAGVHNREAGVVGGQNPVGAVGSNWETHTRDWDWWSVVRHIYSQCIHEITTLNNCVTFTILV